MIINCFKIITGMGKYLLQKDYTKILNKLIIINCYRDESKNK